MFYLTRKLTFSAAHVCRFPEWSDEQNQEIYGACAMGSVHGHNYVCELTVRGKTDDRTGVVINLTEVKQILKQVVADLDMAHLNHDITAFLTRVPTTEMLALVLWDRILSTCDYCKIFRLRLHESRIRLIEYMGEDRMVYVTRRVEFNAAHRLHSQALSDEENARVFGKCNNPSGHGHNYELEVTVRGPVDERTGTVVALDHLDRVIEQEIVERYDHRYLNVDMEEFRTVNPTSEEFARVIWNRLAPHFTIPALYRIRLVETSNNWFEYYGEQET